MNMTKLSHTLATLLAANLAFAPMAALAESEGTVDAATAEKVTATMTEQGYDVRKLAIEDGMIEVYAVKDGKTCEVYLKADLTVDHESCN
jgi:hypothetical protein